MNVENICPGLWVRVIDLESFPMMFTDPTYTANRRMGSIGEVLKPMNNIPHAWWIKHEHGSAPYCFDEIEALDPQPPKEEDWGGSPIF